MTALEHLIEEVNLAWLCRWLKRI